MHSFYDPQLCSVPFNYRRSEQIYYKRRSDLRASHVSLNWEINYFLNPLPWLSARLIYPISTSSQHTQL